MAGIQILANLPYLWIFLIFLALKVLLFPAYRSTDFEVHRNWLAITHNLPLQLWYYEKQHSEWTLDYPPYFGYFEYILSQFAKVVDPKMLQLENVNYSSIETIYFQRITVLLSELFLVFAVIRYFSRSPSLSVYFLTIANAGLVLVDNIHFQYNSMLLGILILCLDFAKRGQYLLLTIAFSILVLLKHLFVPLAVIFGLYLLINYCNLLHSLSSLPYFLTFLRRFITLVLIAVTAISIAFLPFVLSTSCHPDSHSYIPLPAFPSSFSHEQLFFCTDHLLQIFSRLFPFGRGLVHAYWAPNLWALYVLFDLLLSLLHRKFHIQFLPLCSSESTSIAAGHSATSGLVGDFHFTFLPRIQPLTSLLLVLLFTIGPVFLSFFLFASASHTSASLSPATVSPKEGRIPVRLLVKGIVYGALTSFMLGYHVHEKAILVALLPATLLLNPDTSPTSQGQPRSQLSHGIFLQCAAGGIIGLLPLFPHPQELLLKGTICFSFLFLSRQILLPKTSLFFSRLNAVTLALLSFVFLYAELLHPFIFRLPSGDIRFPFLPLLLYSTSCALVLTHVWFLSGISLFVLDDDEEKDDQQQQQQLSPGSVGGGKEVNQLQQEKKSTQRQRKDNGNKKVTIH